jgi:pimeloyl-ACP methyl ester carboxylesterase
VLRAFIAAVAAAALLGGSGAAGTSMRLELQVAPGARTSPHMLLLTLGGPIYCAQLRTLAAHVDASLACTDYGPNRYDALGQRAGRREDWGDPGYLAEVARVPAELQRSGIKVSKLVVVGVSYSGYANAELVATHPELHPAALVVVDSFLDLPARYAALPASHPTRKEMELVLGGTLAERRPVYEARSPSHHLDGLARAIRGGMSFVDVWSVSAAEQREFRGATCSLLANARWMADLATVLRAPVIGYVTQMPHAHALWDRGMGLLQLAGVAKTDRPLLAHRVTFRPGVAPPAGSYCSS